MDKGKSPFGTLNERLFGKKNEPKKGPIKPTKDEIDITEKRETDALNRKGNRNRIKNKVARLTRRGNNVKLRKIAKSATIKRRNRKRPSTRNSIRRV